MYFCELFFQCSVPDNRTVRTVSYENISVAAAGLNFSLDGDSRLRKDWFLGTSNYIPIFTVIDAAPNSFCNVYYITFSNVCLISMLD